MGRPLWIDLPPRRFASHSAQREDNYSGSDAEAHRRTGRPQAGVHVERGTAAPVDPLVKVVGEVRKRKLAPQERDRDLSAVRVAAQGELDVAPGGRAEALGIVCKKEGGRARLTLCERTIDVVAFRPGVIDGTDEHLGAVPLHERALVSKDAWTTRPNLGNERLAIAEIVMVPHRDVDAVLRRQRSED